MAEVEVLKAERNAVSREIGQTKDTASRQLKIDSMKLVGDKISDFDNELRIVEADLLERTSELPNLPDDRTPYGLNEDENVILETTGSIPEFDFTPKPHWEIGTDLDIINFEQGVKITGSRFYVLNGAGARLQRALIAWMLDLHERQGYTEKYTPFMVREKTMFAAGQLPKFIDNLYRDHEEDYWMVPTAEVPLTGIHMDDIIPESDLPLYYMAYTPCFRREKMSAGRDVRGIKRGHQFDKVEMYIYCRPEESDGMLEKMRKDAEETCTELGFTYRVKQLCTGDLGFGARMTYDIEVWAPGCDEWLEVSSVSNVGDFQARRSNIKYRQTDGGKTSFLHTLNGSGLGMPRTLIALLENYQQPDGSVVVPEVLRPWMGGLSVIKPQRRKNIVNLSESILNIVILLTMLVGLLGLVIPIFPGLVIIWIGGLAYGLITGFEFPAWLIFSFLTVIMIVGSLLDNFVMGKQAHKQGASLLSIVLAIVFGIVGTFIIPIIGGFIGAILALFIAEWIRRKNWREAINATSGLAVGCGWAVVLRFGLGVVMIALWGVWVFTLILQTYLFHSTSIESFTSEPRNLVKCIHIYENNQINGGKSITAWMELHPKDTLVSGELAWV